MAEKRKNDGKLFEAEIKASFPPDFYVERYKDDTSGFYGVSNPADYRLYRYPYTFLLELKTHRGKSIPFSKLRENQITGMRKAVEYKGIFGGFIFNFRELEETYYIPIDQILFYMDYQSKEGGRKSFPIEWVREAGELIPQYKKRVRYSYDLGIWLDRYYTSSRGGGIL